MGGAVKRDQRTPVISTATLLSTPQVPCTQHVAGEVELGFLGALGVLEDGDGESSKYGGDRDNVHGATLHVAPDGPLAPAGHGVVADQQQLLLRKFFGRQANGDDVAVQGDGSIQLQQGHVAVTRL